MQLLRIPLFGIVLPHEVDDTRGSEDSKRNPVCFRAADHIVEAVVDLRGFQEKLTTLTQLSSVLM